MKYVVYFREGNDVYKLLSCSKQEAKVAIDFFMEQGKEFVKVCRLVKGEDVLIKDVIRFLKS